MISVALSFPPLPLSALDEDDRALDDVVDRSRLSTVDGRAVVDRVRCALRSTCSSLTVTESPLTAVTVPTGRMFLMSSFTRLCSTFQPIDHARDARRPRARR